ncbi:hypothetical protein [Pilimelia columellifera]|uniref:Uncharacterized protein n=1 Tax=Pilimelia columellifera subsp. columellifera TaxID=706583 RepID=A0ABN3NAW8_9ACTN
MIIGARFNGPDGSGNGGYTAGLVAALLGAGTAEVTLRLPPPLEVELTTVVDGDTATAHDGERLVAQARVVAPVAGTVPPVDLATATAVASGYPGFTDHPFPRCYVCGPERPDGLAIYPGPLPDGRVASPFIAPEAVSAPVVWAALDCPGGWSVLGQGRPYVLGRMTATVRALPAAGEVCVVVGRCDAVEGRKAQVSSTLWSSTGAALGSARATWIAVS